jgi:hypothetical protein
VKLPQFSIYAMLVAITSIAMLIGTLRTAEGDPILIFFFAGFISVVIGASLVDQAESGWPLMLLGLGLAFWSIAVILGRIAPPIDGG